MKGTVKHMNAQPILKTHHLTKKYHHSIVLDNVSLTIKKGDIYGLVGKNGAGKTTLMRLITSLAFKTSGEIELFGESSDIGLNEAKKRIGTIIEESSFFPFFSAHDNLEYYRIQRGIPGKDSVSNALAFVGLSGTDKKKFKNFSLGMKQRLGLALAIMNSPDLLILDEPINGLDPTGIVDFRNILLKLNQEKNTTIFISSHILPELSNLATCYG
ncbi:MAG: ATP-binding cassette domain-containing protein, partial [Eubacterium sp.]